MNNQFDERLRSRISDVFDNYEDDFANEGWKKLRKKFPVKQQPNPIKYWISTAAATLLLAIGLWTFLPGEQNEETTIAKITQSDTTSELTEGQALEKHAKQNVEVNSEIRTSGQSAINTEKNLRIAYTSIPEKKRTVSHHVNELRTSDTEPADIVESTTKPEMSAHIVVADSSSASSFATPHPVAAGTSPEPALLAKNTEPVVKKRTLLDLALAEENISASKPSDRKVTFAVFAGSFVNYAQGSDNKVNLGAGFTSDIELNKRLKLSTGISISQNNLSFNGTNDIPTTAASTFQSSVQPSSDKMSFISPAMLYSLEKYDAQLLGVDIPINLKYSLSESNSDIFISAGISSGAFINESYTYHYTSSNTGSNFLHTSPEKSNPPANHNEDKVKKDFGNFDIARMLNLSFGIGYPIGKQKLIIEPFVKYPLKEIGAENLRFGAGGVNLKLNFEMNRK